jgi:predicted negative regulator of RcsB-dependent stress response
LRRNDYRIQYNVRNFNIEEAKALVDSDPRKLSVGEMYKVAGTYQKGSAEYNHVMEVAANTYPYIVAAAVNQSALLIADKKYDEALQLLGRSDQNDARILTAQGYAYAGKGDVNKARAAWEKAAAKGSSDAKHNLAELDKYINSL